MTQTTTPTAPNGTSQSLFNTMYNQNLKMADTFKNAGETAEEYAIRETNDWCARMKKLTKKVGNFRY